MILHSFNRILSSLPIQKVNQYTNSNEPQQYSAKSTALIECMAKFWAPHVESEYKVLELGFWGW